MLALKVNVALWCFELIFALVICGRFGGWTVNGALVCDAVPAVLVAVVRQL